MTTRHLRHVRLLALVPLALALALTLAACTPAPATAPAGGTTPVAGATATSEPASGGGPPPTGTAQLTILYTSDEHGWMAPTEDTGGAPGLMQRWIEDEGYTEDGPFLILSGGDVSTGPALSTWFEGESMIDVMNAMGYDAAAIGNHEFDFGLDGLRAREAQAEFPFLAANIIDDATGATPDFALPYVLQDVGDLRVGIVGLASQETPGTTMPTHVAGLSFTDYGPALARVVPQVKDEGADVVVVTSHLCGPEMDALSTVANELGVAMIGGGHCHQRIARVANGVALVEGGWQMAAYGRVDLTIDRATDEVVDVAATVKANPAGAGDPAVQAQVDAWQAQLDDALLVTIGYTRDGIQRSSDAMLSMTMNAWLSSYPADIAMNNPGSYRQDLAAGDITLADVVGLWPFENTLVDVTLTGQQVIASYEHGARRPAVAGLTRDGGRYYVNGEPLDKAATYHVLINDYMYAGGDGYSFADYDPDAYQTGTDWRDPLISWISGLHTTAEDPIENYLN